MSIKKQFIEEYESYDLNQLNKRLSELTMSDFYTKYNEKLKRLHKLENDLDSSRDKSPGLYTELDAYFEINHAKYSELATEIGVLQDMINNKTTSADGYAPGEPNTGGGRRRSNRRSNRRKRYKTKKFKKKNSKKKKSKGKKSKRKKSKKN